MLSFALAAALPSAAQAQTHAAFGTAAIGSFGVEQVDRLMDA